MDCWAIILSTCLGCVLFDCCFCDRNDSLNCLHPSNCKEAGMFKGEVVDDDDVSSVTGGSVL